MSKLDLVLAGGRVFDGLGGPAEVLDVGVIGDRIAAIAAPWSLDGTRSIGCKGLCVAPGFIDTHSHSDLRVLADPALPMKVRQGVTFEVLGQDGLPPDRAALAGGPALRPGGASLADDGEGTKRPSAPFGPSNGQSTWASVAEYMAALAQAKAHLDLAYLVPHGTLRQAVLGMEDRAAAPGELAQMLAALDLAMSEGAIGLSSGLVYPPCSYARKDEIVALSRAVARREGVFAVHLRSESDEVLRALDEVIEVARLSGVRLHVSHLKVAGIQNFAVLEDLVARCEAARQAGIALTADQYPYAAGSTALGAILPPWMRGGGVEETLAKLGSRSVREKLRVELADPRPVDWDNYWKWSGPEGIVIADIPSGRGPELLGRSLAESAARRGVDPFDLAFDLLEAERFGVTMVSHSQSEAVVTRLMALPWVNVCTDGLLGGRPHPRSYGSYPRILGRYVRDRALFPLEEAIRKMTSQAADAFGLDGVGRIAVGARANIVVFDAERVRDEATFAEPVRFPLGIRHVLTGGVQVVRDEVGTGLPGPGRVQRGVGRRLR
ncbi:MAG: D-aminoacylase [Deltaproteobacteria bacterium]|nr:D-aminoacylase [Deltaproteobacteria bacterium]